jgi:hypothetical protein
MATYYIPVIQIIDSVATPSPGLDATVGNSGIGIAHPKPQQNTVIWLILKMSPTFVRDVNSCPHLGMMFPKDIKEAGNVKVKSANSGCNHERNTLMYT